MSKKLEIGNLVFGEPLNFGGVYLGYRQIFSFYNEDIYQIEEDQQGRLTPVENPFKVGVKVITRDGVVGEITNVDFFRSNRTFPYKVSTDGKWYKHTALTVYNPKGKGTEMLENTIKNNEAAIKKALKLEGSRTALKSFQTVAEKYAPEALKGHMDNPVVLILLANVIQEAATVSGNEVAQDLSSEVITAAYTELIQGLNITAMIEEFVKGGE